MLRLRPYYQVTGRSALEGRSAAVSTTRITGLTRARHGAGSGGRAFAPTVGVGDKCLIEGLAAPFTSTAMWYLNPERLMSQVERLPS